MTRLRFLTAGESHGKALVGILEGIPAGLNVSLTCIQSELRRRKLGYGRGPRQKMEDDQVEILSGVRHGKTLGSPIALFIANRDWENWKHILASERPEEGAPVERQVKVPRPGHADYAGAVKYGHQDMRNVLERSSARETTIRVALGSIARQLLSSIGIEIASHVVEMGEVKANPPPPALLFSEWNRVADASDFRILDAGADGAMRAAVESAKEKGDTLGGIFEVGAEGLPIGLGSYVQWDRRLEAAIGEAFLSLNAIKGVEVGLGFQAARLPGSVVHDELVPLLDGIGYLTQRAGGIEGGMTNGQRLLVRAAMKPLSTLMTPLYSIKLETGEVAKAHVERSDVCAVAAAAVIGESLLALVLADSILEKFGADSLTELQGRVQQWRTTSATFS